MTDGFTPGEILREFQRIAEQQRAQDDRVTELARNMALARDVIDLRAQLERAVAARTADMREMRRELERADEQQEQRLKDLINLVNREVDEVKSDITTRHQLSRQQWLGIAAIIATLVAAWIGALISSGGIK